MPRHTLRDLGDGLFVTVIVLLTLQEPTPLILNLPVTVGLDLRAHLSRNILAAKICQGAHVIVLGGKPIRDLLVHHRVIALPETCLIGVLDRLTVTVGGIRQSHTRWQFAGPQHVHDVIGQARQISHSYTASSTLVGWLA